MLLLLLHCVWSLLPAATQDELEHIIAGKPAFADIFDTADPITTTTAGVAFTCPQGYSATNTPGYPQGSLQVTMECLRVKVWRLLLLLLHQPGCK